MKQTVGTTRGPIRIAYVVNEFSAGGAERQLLELLKQLDTRLYQPHLYVGFTAPSRQTDELRELDIPVTGLSGWAGRKAAAFRLARHLRANRPHIVHTYMFAANTWGRVAHLFGGDPVLVSSVRGLELDLSTPYRYLDRLLAPLSDCVLTNSHAVADVQHRVQHVPKKKIATIYNGIDVRRFDPTMEKAEARVALGLPVDVPTIGMVGAFAAVKRWDVFLEAVAQVAPRRHIVAACVGDGGLRPAMEARATALGLGETARFLGQQKNIPAVMASLDVLVLTSDMEGMPNVVMEAMASGRPVVATDAGGTREVVVDGATGFIVPRGDTTALAARISALLDDPHLALSLGETGRRRIEQEFALDVCVARTLALYDALLVAHARKGAPAGPEQGVENGRPRADLGEYRGSR